VRNRVVNGKKALQEVIAALGRLDFLEAGEQLEQSCGEIASLFNPTNAPELIGNWYFLRS
jgi:hypothetical protein